MLSFTDSSTSLSWVSKMRGSCNEKWRITLTVKGKLHLSELLDTLWFMPGQHKKLPYMIIRMHF